MKKLRVISLCSGIGGMDYGLEMTGHYETVGFAEIDGYCRSVLRKHWSEKPIWENVTDVTVESVRAAGIEGDVDLCVAGFPCPPFSKAGKRRGHDDERFLWPDIFRVIRDLKPRYVLLENVDGLISAGIGSGGKRAKGLILTGILYDLHRLGYDAEWRVIPAAAFGAAHLRDRIWIVGYPNPERRSGTADRLEQSGGHEERHDPLCQRSGQTVVSADQSAGEAVVNAQEDGRAVIHYAGSGDLPCSSITTSENQILANNGKTGREECDPPSVAGDTGHTAGRYNPQSRTNGRKDRHEPVLVRDADGVPDGLHRLFSGLEQWIDRYKLIPVAPQGIFQFEWEPPRVVPNDAVNVTYRNASIGALGNAVVPQVVAGIGECLWVFHQQTVQPFQLKVRNVAANRTRRKPKYQVKLRTF